MKLNSMLFGAAVFMAAISSVSAAPLPPSVLGTDKSVNIQNESLAVLSGGGFGGTLEGYSTYFWCVDWENFVAGPPDSYSANVVALSDWTATEKNQVQKGNNTNWALNPPVLSSLQRYQVAAYLLTQMATFQNLAKQTGAALTADQNLQASIWKVLNIGTPSAASPAVANMSPLNAAISYVQSNPTYGFGTFAVVSGVSLNGDLTRTKKQTFLVQIEAAQVPEPGTYALMGLGLGALALIRKRKA
ncbi:PEP-CTERM sorting domain-containing protein [Paludibaculum fermentans]|uniref:PEP-CTERM sorting domain-containing protein n=1 Tax=Paludibaculum fermentans TaxID=1473598 RepID=UPI003EB75236